MNTASIPIQALLSTRRRPDSLATLITTGLTVWLLGLIVARILDNPTAIVWTDAIVGVAGCLVLLVAAKRLSKRIVLADALEKRLIAYQADAKQLVRSPLAGRINENDGYVWTLRDITQSALARQSHEHFLASASHELRTPLTNIKAYSESLLELDGIAPEKQKEFFNVIHSEANRLGRLLNQLLDIQQLEAGSMTIKLAAFDAQRMVQEVQEHILPVVNEKQQRLTCRIAPNVAHSIISNGNSLSATVSAQESVLGKYVRASIQAGEASGKLADVLRQIAVQLEEELSIRSTITGALAYPAILCAASSLVATIPVWFVLPQFEESFDSMGVEPPIVNRFLFLLANLLRENVFIVGVGSCVATALAWLLAMQSASRELFYSLCFRSPVLGAALINLAIGQFFLRIGHLLNNGISLLEAMQLTQRATAQGAVRKLLDAWEQDVMEGKGLTSSLSTFKQLPVTSRGSESPKGAASPKGAESSKGADSSKGANGHIQLRLVTENSTHSSTVMQCLNASGNFDEVKAISSLEQVEAGRLDLQFTIRCTFQVE